MRGGPEQEVKRQISDFLNFKGIFFWWNHSTGLFDPTTKKYRKRNGKYDLNGTSDIIGIYHGKILCIEVKAGRNTLSQHQLVFLTRVIEHGGIGMVAYSVEDVAELLDASPEILLNALLGSQSCDKTAIN